MFTHKKLLTGIPVLLLVFGLLFASCGGGGGNGGIPSVASLELGDVPTLNFGGATSIETADLPANIVSDSSPLKDVIALVQLVFTFYQDASHGFWMDHLYDLGSDTGDLMFNFASLTPAQQDILDDELEDLIDYLGINSIEIDTLTGTGRFWGKSWFADDNFNYRVQFNNISSTFTIEAPGLKIAAELSGTGNGHIRGTHGATITTSTETIASASSAAAAFINNGVAGRLIFNYGYYIDGVMTYDWNADEEDFDLDDFEMDGNIVVYGISGTNPVLQSRKFTQTELDTMVSWWDETGPSGDPGP